MPGPLGGRQQRSAGIGAGELLECAWPEVAHIVNMVALKQPGHLVAGGWPHRNLQQQVTVPQRLIVDLEGCLVVAKPLKGPHDTAAQSVVAAMLIQDARSLLPAQNLHGCDIHPGRGEVCGDGGDLRLSVSRPTTW